MEPAPQFDRFTGQARRAIWLAYQEAQRFDHDYLASDHLLAGLLREGAGETTQTFRDQAIEPSEILEKLEATLAQSEPGPVSSHVFMTPRANHALNAAVDLARQTPDALANPAHILLALIADPDNTTRGLLNDLGFDIDRGQRTLRDLSLAPNRDQLVKSTSSSGDIARVDPTATQLAQLLTITPLQVDLNAEEMRAAAIDPALAEVDYQLFLTQLILALTLGLAGGYTVYQSFDGMVGAAVVLGLVACFRNSLLGTCAGVVLGIMVAQKLQPGNLLLASPIEALIPLIVVGGFLGSFLGGFWRRACPKYLRPATTHQKPPGVV